MRRRDFLRALAAVPVGVAAALGVKAEAALGVRAEAAVAAAVEPDWSALLDTPWVRIPGGYQSTWFPNLTVSNASTAFAPVAHWTPPPLTTEQRRALDDYYAEPIIETPVARGVVEGFGARPRATHPEPLEVLHSAERPLRWERHADGWHSIWTDK